MNRYRFIFDGKIEIKVAFYDKVKKYVLADYEKYCESYVTSNCLDGYVFAKEALGAVMLDNLWKIRNGRKLDGFEIGCLQRGKRIVDGMELKQKNE